MGYRARNKLSRSLVHMKNLRLMSQVRFKLRYLFSQENLIRLLKKCPCYDVLILFSSQQVLEKHRLMYKKSDKVVFKLLSIVSFLNTSVRVYSLKLEIGMLYHMSNAFQNTVFRYLSICLNLSNTIKGSA